MTSPQPEVAILCRVIASHLGCRYGETSHESVTDDDTGAASTGAGGGMMAKFLAMRASQGKHWKQKQVKTILLLKLLSNTWIVHEMNIMSVT